MTGCASGGSRGANDSCYSQGERDEKRFSSSSVPFCRLSGLVVRRVEQAALVLDGIRQQVAVSLVDLFDRCSHAPQGYAKHLPKKTGHARAPFAELQERQRVIAFDKTCSPLRCNGVM
jgi:hypothetical protein